MLANNETGVIQPIAEVVRRCAPLGIPVHIDAVQAAGKIAIDFRALGVAAISVAPHKFGGPRGIGALVVKHGVALSPLLHGATQQGGVRPGTESVTLAIGFLTALQIWTRDRENFPRGCTTFAANWRRGFNPLCRKPSSMAVVRRDCHTPRMLPSSVTIGRLCSWRSIWPAFAARPAAPAPVAPASPRQRSSL